jgi:hypothetical protein
MQNVKASGLNQGGKGQEIYHAKNAKIDWYS